MSLTPILKRIPEKLAEAGVDGLLIGGFAVNHYGYTRNTLDVDFMVVGDDIETVEEIMRAAGFMNVDRRDNVVFFSGAEPGVRVDFLKVDRATMQNLLERAVDASVLGVNMKLPALLDLLAMKLHALTQDTAGRMGKDLPDIAYLSILHHLHPKHDLDPLFRRYATPEIERLVLDHIKALTE